MIKPLKFLISIPEIIIAILFTLALWLYRYPASNQPALCIWPLISLYIDMGIHDNICCMPWPTKSEF